MHHNGSPAVHHLKNFQEGCHWLQVMALNDRQPFLSSEVVVKFQKSIKFRAFLGRDAISPSSANFVGSRFVKLLLKVIFMLRNVDDLRCKCRPFESQNGCGVRALQILRRRDAMHPSNRWRKPYFANTDMASASQYLNQGLLRPPQEYKNAHHEWRVKTNSLQPKPPAHVFSLVSMNPLG